MILCTRNSECFSWLLKTLPAFSEIRRFITFFAKARWIPIHICKPYFLKIPFNIIILFTPRSYEWSLSFRISNQICVVTPEHTLYFLTIWSYSIWPSCRVQIMGHLIIWFSHSPITSTLLEQNIFPSALSIRVLSLMWDQVSHPEKRKHF